MRFNVKYVGGGGEVCFSKPPFSYKTNDFSDYIREYESNNIPLNFGTNINKFTRVGREYKITLNLVTKTREELYEVLNGMTDLFQQDVNNLTPAKLCVNDRYVLGYVTSVSETEWERPSDYVVVILTFFALDPVWIKEKVFKKSVFGSGVSGDGFKFPMKFPAFFKARKTSLTVDNLSGGTDLAKIIFYGEVTNPKITINNQPYQVFGELLENERFEIDQRDKSVVKIDSSGTVFNAFNDRQKYPSVFTPLPKGNNIVNYNENFSVEIILFEGRVEPEWK